MIRTLLILMQRMNRAEGVAIHQARLASGLFIWQSCTWWRNLTGWAVRVLVGVPSVCRGARRQVPTHHRVVIAMAVVVQARLRVEVMPLKTQWLFDHPVRVAMQSSETAVGAVLCGPDDPAAGISELLGRAKVVELVVIGTRVGWSLAV